MAKTETPTTEKTARSKKVSSMLLGLDLDAWNFWLLVSLALGAVAAAGGVFSTYAVIRLQKAESLEAAKQISEANARAEEAKLALEKLKAPRILSGDAAAKIIKRLSEFKGQTAGVLAQPQTAESTRLAGQLHTVLNAAQIKTGYSPQGAVVATGMGTGVVIRFTTGSSKGEACAKALAEELNEHGILASAVGGFMEDLLQKSESRGENVGREKRTSIYVLVGDKA